MRPLLSIALLSALVACAGHDLRPNRDFSAPTAPAIARSLALRERHNVPTHVGKTAIFIDTVAAHHIYAEASTIVWKDEAGKWQWSQVSETGPGGLLPATARRLESNTSRSLTDADSAALDRLISDRNLYRELGKATGITGVGAPSHVMSIVTPFGRTTISWHGRLEGIGGQIADIVLGKD
jgi:hypothetical protein